MPIHPAFAEHLALLDGIPGFAEQPHPATPELLAKLDAFARATGGGEPPIIGTQEVAVPGPNGPIRIRIYGVTSDRIERPGMIWFHGGAFRYGSIDMPEADWVARAVSVRTGAIVASVDYRLVDDFTRYPVPHDDAVAAIRWLRDHGPDFGIDPHRITIGGASAGGNLAAGGTLKLRDVEQWMPAHLLLAYPVLHRHLPPDSGATVTGLTEVPRFLRFTPADVRAMNEAYVGRPVERAEPYAFPGSAELEGLCGTTIVLAEYDDLRASGQAFAADLALAGVDVSQATVPGTLHGFFNHSPRLEPVGHGVDLLCATVSSNHGRV